MQLLRQGTCRGWSMQHAVETGSTHLDVLDPGLVGLHRVAGDGDHLAVPLGKLGDQVGHLPQLCGAHWGEVGGVGEEHAPAVCGERTGVKNRCIAS